MSLLDRIDAEMKIGTPEQALIISNYPDQSSQHPVNIQERSFLLGAERMRGCASKSLLHTGYSSSTHRDPRLLDLVDPAWDEQALPADHIDLPPSIIADEDASWDQKLLPVEREAWQDMGTQGFL